MQANWYSRMCHEVESDYEPSLIAIAAIRDYFIIHYDIDMCTDHNH